jgi:hypothetical protein
MSLEDVNTLAGLAALVNSLILAPTVLALRKIANRHDEDLDDLDDRVVDLEEAGDPVPPRRRKRRRRAR